MKIQLFFLLLCVSCLICAAEKQHPSLVDPAKAKCNLCHKEVMEGKVHPIVEDGCDNCHEMSKKEGKTTVSLVEEGNDLCTMCHDDKSDVFDRETMHAAVDECLNCHKPHTSEEDYLLTGSLPELCFECHDKNEMKKEIHQGQPVHSTNCVKCHDSHGNNRPHMLTGKVQHPPFADISCNACHRKTRTKKARLITPEPSLCYACHGDLEDKFKGKSIHGPVEDGKCTKCHDPHQSEKGKLLANKSPDLCFGCHEEIQKLVKKNVHMAVEDGCESCHGIHATSRPHLLTEDMMPEGAISSLCASCHDLDEIKPKHLGAKMESLDCITCHNPHGSSEEHLFNTQSFHAVFDDCENCHTEGVELMEEQPDLCYMCHDGIQEHVEGAAVAHDAIDMGCTSCHTPHASPSKHLIKGKQVEVCGECHEMNHPVYHGVIESVGCQACHEPHGGSGEKLLKATGNKLCLKCHDQDGEENIIRKAVPGEITPIILNKEKTIGHPVVRHPVTGKAEGRKPIYMPEGVKELSCLACHNPHGGKTASLYAYDKESQYDLCSVCHRK